MLMHALEVRVNAKDDKGRNRKVLISSRQGYYMKSCTHRLAKKLLSRDVKDCLIRFVIEYVTQDAVVRSNEELSTSDCQKRPPFRTHTWINDRDVNCSVRK